MLALATRECKWPLWSSLGGGIPAAALAARLPAVTLCAASSQDLVQPDRGSSWPSRPTVIFGRACSCLRVGVVPEREQLVERSGPFRRSGGLAEQGEARRSWGSVVVVVGACAGRGRRRVARLGTQPPRSPAASTARQHQTADGGAGDAAVIARRRGARCLGTGRGGPAAPGGAGRGPMPRGAPTVVGRRSPPAGASARISRRRGAARVLLEAGRRRPRSGESRGDALDRRHRRAGARAARVSARTAVRRRASRRAHPARNIGAVAAAARPAPAKVAGAETDRCGEATRVWSLGDAEVGELDAAVRQQHVGGFTSRCTSPCRGLRRAGRTVGDAAPVVERPVGESSASVRLTAHTGGDVCSTS